MASQIPVRMLIETGRRLDRTERRRRRGVRGGDHRTRRAQRPQLQALPDRALCHPRRPLPPGRSDEPGPRAIGPRSDGAGTSISKGSTEELRRSMVAYLERLSATLSRSTVSGTASELAHFGRFLTAIDPDLVDLRRPGPPSAHRALPERRGHGRQPAHRGAGRHLDATQPHPGGRPDARRHDRVGLGGGPGPSAGLRPGQSSPATAPAALPSSRRGPAAGRRARGIAQPAVRRRAAARPCDGRPDRRAARSRARQRPRGPRPGGVAEGAARQAGHRTHGPPRRRDRRTDRPDRRAPLAGPAAPPPKERAPGRVPPHPPWAPDQRRRAAR